MYQELSAPSGGRGCPSSETLARAAAGDLDPAAHDAVVTHLETCQPCAQDFRIACGLHGEEAAGHTRVPAFWRRPGISQALAASLAMATAGLLTWNVRLLERSSWLAARLAQAERTRPASGPASPGVPASPQPAIQPQVNVPIVDLEPPSARRGEGSRPQVIRIPRDAALVALVVNSSAEQRYAEYVLELSDANGATVWGGAGLRPDADGTLSVALPTALLPPGEYAFALAGVANSRRVPLHRYPVTVVHR